MVYDGENLRKVAALWSFTALLVGQSSWHDKFLSISGTLTTSNTHTRLDFTPHNLVVQTPLFGHKDEWPKWSKAHVAFKATSHTALSEAEYEVGWTTS